MATNIIVLDCQQMFTEGMEAYFSLYAKSHNIRNQVCTSEELSLAVQNNQFDVLILDLNIIDQDGMIIIKEMKAQCPDMHIIVLSAYTDYKLVRNSMVNGADAYVSKNSNFDELLFALQEVLEGQTYIGQGLRTSPAVKSNRRKVQAKESYNDSYSLKQKLTKREAEILELIAQGKNNKNIGSELFISDQTVGVHRKNIMKKLGIRNTVSLIKFALEHHLV